MWAKPFRRPWIAAAGLLRLAAASAQWVRT
jgi:hypothetical protein